ncbi:hypothetical protein [Roseomonas chloroacetimidivorans]|uniref:hypothetical protein n=1 Tax=Roseomonas chloroacetimidivorans TaxID=1766656 RepID=UPI003C765046
MMMAKTAMPAGTAERMYVHHTTDADAWNAKARREAEIQAEREEREAAMPAGDRGTEGPAMVDRGAPERLPSDMPGYAAMAYRDVHLIDRMWDRGQMTDDQHQQALRVYGLFRRAGLEPRTCSPPGERRDPTVEADDATDEARASWTRFLKRREIAGQKAELLIAMCLQQHPGVRWLATLHSALAEVSKLKRLDPEHSS